MSASVSTLRKLARFYKTNILDFFDPAESNIRLVSPDKRKVLEAGPGVRMELLAWGNTVMEPHLSASLLIPAAASRTIMKARSSCTSCRESCRFRCRKRSTISSRVIVFISRAPPPIAGKTGRSETWVLRVNTPPTF